MANLGSTAANSFRTHQVKEGDSLRTLSTQYYGNADYWYIIADANGLTSDVNDPLVVGQTLEIPHQANTANSFDSFTAYNIAEQIGDTQPSLPYVPVPQEADCNVIAALIVVAIAVVVTGGAGVALANGALGGAFVGSTAGTLSVLGGATAAVAGSVASQVVGIGLGVQESFSWSQVAVAAITGGIAAGISDAAGVGGLLEDGNELLTQAGAGANLGTAVLNPLGRAVVGASSVLGAAATNKIIGGSSGFSWANVAASAVSASLGSPLPGETGSGRFFTDVGNSILGSAAGYATSKLINSEGTWNNRDVLVDAFGNAIGNSIVSQAQKQPEPRFTGTIDSSKLNDSIGNQFGDDFNTTIGNSSVEVIIAQTGAINIDLKTVKAEDITPFALTDAGLKFATEGLVNAQQTGAAIKGLGGLEASLKARVDATVTNEQNNTIRAERLIDPIAAADALARPSVKGYSTILNAEVEFKLNAGKRSKGNLEVEGKLFLAQKSDTATEYFGGTELVSDESGIRVGRLTSTKVEEFANTFINQKRQAVSEFGKKGQVKNTLAIFGATGDGTSGGISVLNLNGESKFSFTKSNVFGDGSFPSPGYEAKLTLDFGKVDRIDIETININNNLRLKVINEFSAAYGPGVNLKVSTAPGDDLLSFGVSKVRLNNTTKVELQLRNGTIPNVPSILDSIQSSSYVPSNIKVFIDENQKSLFKN